MCQAWAGSWGDRLLELAGAWGSESRKWVIALGFRERCHLYPGPRDISQGGACPPILSCPLLPVSLMSLLTSGLPSPLLFQARYSLVPPESPPLPHCRVVRAPALAIVPFSPAVTSSSQGQHLCPSINQHTTCTEFLAVDIGERTHERMHKQTKQNPTGERKK